MDTQDGQEMGEGIFFDEVITESGFSNPLFY